MKEPSSNLRPVDDSFVAPTLVDEDGQTVDGGRVVLFKQIASTETIGDFDSEYYSHLSSTFDRVADHLRKPSIV